MPGGGNRCSVAICNSHSATSSKSLKFFRFPRDPIIKKVWIQKCYRKNSTTWNPDTARICSKHFTDEDFEDALMAKLLQLKPKKLKATAIPSLYLLPQKSQDAIANKRSNKYSEQKHRKEIVEELLENNSLEAKNRQQIACFGEEMFHIVRFNSDVTREKTVVPSIWLNKNETLCTLPPVTMASEIGNLALHDLAQLSAQPSETWRMFDVTSLKTFETYAEAKEYLKRMKRAASPETQRSDRIQRKKKRPAHLNAYATSDEDGDDEAEGGDRSGPLRNDSNSSPPSGGGISTEHPAADPLIVKIESRSAGGSARSDRSSISPSDFVIFPAEGGKGLSTHREENATSRRKNDVNAAECPCHSACHRLILQSLIRIQSEMETNTRLLRQLLNDKDRILLPPAERTPRTPHHYLSKEFPIQLPTTDIKGIEELEAYLQEDSNFLQSLLYFKGVGGNGAKQTLKRLMEKVISADLALQLNWKGRGTKKPFSNYTRIHSLMFNAVKQNPSAEAVTLSDIERFIKDWLRFAADRTGIRKCKKPEDA